MKQRHLTTALISVCSITAGCVGASPQPDARQVVNSVDRPSAEFPAAVADNELTPSEYAGIVDRTVECLEGQEFAVERFPVGDSIRVVLQVAFGDEATTDSEFEDAGDRYNACLAIEMDAANDLLEAQSGK